MQLLPNTFVNQTPKEGSHLGLNFECPLCAKNGHSGYCILSIAGGISALDVLGPSTSVLIANLNVLNFAIVDDHILPARSMYYFSIESIAGESEIEKNESWLNRVDAVHIPTHCFETGEKLRLHVHNLISAKVNTLIRGAVGARRREQLFDIR